jgi:hypothetical protein
MQWMQSYYFDPMERLTSRLTYASERTALISPRTYTSIVVRQSGIQQQTNPDSNAGAVCALVCCVIIVVIVIIIIAIAISS